jgi:hypothetical protein
MKRHISYILIIFLLASNVTFIHSANAAKIGATCKKVNAKSWSGNTPIVCKKNSKGKLVWTKFGSSSTSEVSYSLAVTLRELNETRPTYDPDALRICNNSGYRFPDITKTSSLEVRDANGKILAVSLLGEATVSDGLVYYSGMADHPSDCIFEFVITLKKSDFYQFKLGSRLDQTLTFDYLVSKNWKLNLTIGVIQQ